MAPLEDSLAHHQRLQRTDTLSLPKVYKVTSFSCSCLQALGWYDLPCVVWARKVIRHRVSTAIMLLSLFCALFLHDIFAAAQVRSSVELDIILTAVMALFFSEFLGQVLTEATYVLSFFFWMDLIGTALMAFDISFMAGTDAAEPEVKGVSEPDALMIVRTTRVAKLAARAGRLSRMMKMLRLVPSWDSVRNLIGCRQADADKKHSPGQKVRMAAVISNQLSNVLSTRVAFLTICIVVCVPLLSIWLYPADDDSMEVWVTLLSRNADLYNEAVLSGNASDILFYTQWMTAEVQRFSKFYAGLMYGPFDACYGILSGDQFHCQPEILNIGFSSGFGTPGRKSSILEINRDSFHARFNLVEPKRQEAFANIGLICFVIVVMCGFGLIMNKKITGIAVEPLERMLTAVRKNCAAIFQYMDELRFDGEVEEYDDNEQTSEFHLLERVVSKLANIVKLSTATPGPQQKAGLTANDAMVYHWMQGDPLINFQTRTWLPAGRETPTPLFDSSPEGDNEETPVVVPRRVPLMGPLPNQLFLELQHDAFDAFALSQELKIHAILHTISTSPGCEAWVQTNVREAQLQKFLVALEAKYLPNPFHNFSHAVDVVVQVSRFLQLVDAQELFSDATHFWLQIAAAAHDAGHLGVNNQFLIETSHDLAVRYNDRAPLENLHCATLFQLVNDPKANIFSLVQKDLYKEMRAGIIHVVLHTDMSKHFELVNHMALLYRMNQEAFDELDPSPCCASPANVQLCLSMFLHGADIANPMKPWALAKKLAYLCIEEFFAQGDLEREAAIPVQMLNDRNKVSPPNAQVGFIEFVIAPMAEGMINLFPTLESLAMNLEENIQHWAQIWKEEAAPPVEEISKIDGRVGHIRDNLNSLLQRSADLLHS